LSTSFASFLQCASRCNQSIAYQICCVGVKAKQQKQALSQTSSRLMLCRQAKLKGLLMGYLMAPTRPSIMSDGDTTSAPALACETACRHRNSTVSSFMITPASLTMPS